MHLDLIVDRVMGVNMIERTYTELSRLGSFIERYEYLKLNALVGMETFGYDRYLNQLLYRSREWRRSRDFVITRDNGCDLGMEGYDIGGFITVHHMNPITPEQIKSGCENIFDSEFLICTMDITHKAIHYGDASLLRKPLVERRKNDTCPWL